MNKFSDIVVHHKRTVIVVFIAVAVICMVISSFVSVNYKMVDYLPDDALSTNAITIMKDEFGGSLPNARVMISGISISEALTYKDKLAKTEGISDVSWLDDVVGRGTLTSTPAEFLDQTLLQNYYKDGSALISITVESGKEKDTVARVRALIGDGNAVAGEASETASAQEMSVSEVAKAMGILLPVIIIILLLTTTSWIEPLLFLASIGIAVIINMGTNAFLGQTSFVTQTISPILQLAVSLDYAIFLLHSFSAYRKDHPPETAMKLAMKKSVSAIAASAATTVFGFMALMFMRFEIGSDLGINLVKGVTISFVSVMVFLPALTLMGYQLIDRTKHRKLIPDFTKAGKWLTKISLPFLIVAVIVVVPSFLAQTNVTFMYGMGSMTKQSVAGKEAALVEKKFGSENTLVLLVPGKDKGKETELCSELNNISHVTNVVSYVTSVGAEIPAEYLEKQITDQFYSKNYTRVILYTDMEAEGDDAFQTVKKVTETTEKYYDNFYMAGQSATLYDMKNIVSTDTNVVNLCAIIGIFLVLLLTYKSLTMPLFLLFTIETAIWVNLSFSYFGSLSFSFIGFLVISTVQLGATVDYAILLSDRYLSNRKEMGKKEAIRKALGDNIVAILTSATILATAGFALALTSSNKIISELGTLLGRGTILSLAMVLFVLPSLLTIFDKVIQKTSLNHGFHKQKGISGDQRP
ncbi:MAG: RND transporter [Clostridiales bacterium 43-6]|nr:MAG: RND transporter [Clostridiales bacterium 43-6]